MPGALDHLLAAGFGVVYAAIAYVWYERRRPDLAAGRAGARLREYRDTILALGAMGVCTVAVWRLAARPWTELGLGGLAPTRATAVAGIGVVAVAALFGFQLWKIRSDPRWQQAVREQTAAVDEYLPTTAAEGHRFFALAASAGIGEELFYRGFLTWYLDAYLPALAAVALSVVAFAAAHLMHGRQATLRAGAMGAIFSGLYAWSGALWLPFVLHFLIDAFAGQAALASRRAAAG